MTFPGEAAAVCTALFWSGGSVLFTRAGRRIGSTSVNRLRLWFALLWLLGWQSLLAGGLPLSRFSGPPLFWLSLSGIVGYVIGDGMLFESFVLVGPRLAMLMYTTVPVFGALLAWIFLGEILSVPEILAIAVTLTGIAIVIGERNPEGPGRHQSFMPGILLGLGGAAGQAAGLLFAKKGLAGGFPPLTGNLIRVGAAASFFLIFSMVRGKLRHHLLALRNRSAAVEMAVASILGPVVGVVLSLYAIAHTRIGVASTLMSLTPIFLIPLSRLIFKETISRRAVMGTVVAVVGSALLFF